MIVDVDKIVVILDVVSPDAVVVEASAVAPSGIVTEAVAELPTQVIVISHEETPTVTPLQIIDYGSSSIECAFDVTTEQADEVVKGVLCGTTNPPTFENADYRLLHGQGSMDLVIAGLHRNTEYYLRPYALSNLGYKYGDVVAQRTKASPIPEEYQLVEWLESTGVQYIDTGIYPDASTVFSFDCIPYANTRFFGAINNTNANNFAFGTNGYYHLFNRTNQIAIQPAVNIRHTVALSAKEGCAIVDGNRYGVLSGTIISNYTIWLGNFSYNSGSLFVGRWYRAFGEKATDTYDFYPVYRKSDNKTGLFDIVNQQFKENKGATEFMVGPDKEWEE